MADRSELLFELVGQVGRHLQAAVPQWDGFAVVARFGSPLPGLDTWYYVADEPGARSAVAPPQAASTFDQLRAAVEVPAELVRVGVLTYVRDSGITDLQMISSEAEASRLTATPAAEIGAFLRPGQIPGSVAPAEVPSSTRPLSVWRADPAAPDGVAPDESLPRLSAADAVRVADYLDAGAVVASTAMRLPDAWSGDRRAVVGLTRRTDGVWRWDDAVSYYVRRYGLSPGAEFVEDVRARGFRVPEVSEVQLSAVIDEVFGAADAGPEHQVIRLDGSQLLPESYYARYRGVVFRCQNNRLGTLLLVAPGQQIPEDFEVHDRSESLLPSVASKRVPTVEVDAFVRVITTCEYKGAPFSIRDIRGQRLRVSIGGGRRIKPSQEPARPTREQWSEFPNVDVLGMGDLWADLDVVEAARVTMAVVPYHLVQGQLSPVHDPSGYGVAVPSADQIFYFPSPAASPFLPREQALGIVRDYVSVHNPDFPAGEAVARRLRDGWMLTASGSASQVYCVADDGVVLVASGSASLAQVSSHLSAQFRARHPIVEPGPAHDSGTEYFD